MTDLLPSLSVRPTLLALVLALAGPAGSSMAQDTASLVTMSVQGEDLGSLLRAMAVQHRLNLVMGTEVSGNVTVNFYDVPLDQALSQMLATQGLCFVKQDEFYRVMTLEERRTMEQELDPIETRVLNLNHITAAEAQQLLGPLLTDAGALSLVSEQGANGAGSSGAAGGGASEGTTGSGHRQSIVLRDRSSGVAAIVKALEALDVPPRQVLLEATILSVNLGEDNRLGVDFNVLGGIDFENVGAGSDLSGVGPYGVGGGALNDALFSGQTFGFTNDPPGRGLSLGFVKNSVAAFVEALEETTNATIVSNPRVLALNGHEAEIIVGGRLGYRTLLTTQTSSLEEVQFLDTGTQLVFRPFVGDDGWIRMDVHPENSTGVVDPVSGIPSETTTEITTKILMRDGQTLILGGLISESVSTVQSQVPLLGSLPLIGWLFGRTQETINRSELVILLTPHILDPVEAQLDAELAQKRFEAVRRSHWDSLSPYIRPSLARNQRADAAVLQAQGSLVAALGAAECALSFDPTDADAAMLRRTLMEQIALRSLDRSGEQAALDLLEQWEELPVGGPPGRWR